MKAIPIISKPIYLQDKDPMIKLIECEGDQECPRDQQAYIIVRQPTEGDMMRLNELTKDEKIEYGMDGTMRAAPAPTDMIDAWRVYLCLAGAGNICKADGKTPIFTFEDGGNYPRMKGEFDNFMNVWREIPTIIAGVIRRQVNLANITVWGKLGEAEEEDSESTSDS